MLAPRIHVLKHNKQSLSLEHRDKQYVVGFFSNSHARKVMKIIDMGRSMCVQRSRIDDVTEEVNHELKELDIDRRIPELTIDSEAKLIVPVKPMRSGHREVTTGLDLLDMETSEMIMYPFDWNIGIVMAHELSHIHNTHHVYDAYVIDPCGSNIDMLRRMMA